MSGPHLHPEVLDHVVDLLHDAEAVLRTCSLVSRSWVPRARRHLFAQIRFGSARDLQSWKSTFLDPSTSPAYYATALSIGCPQEVVAVDAEEGGWIRAFSRIVKLEIDEPLDLESTVSLDPLCGAFPALQSLDINVSTIEPSQLYSFIYSFPLLEDLSLALQEERRDFNDGVDERTIALPPASSPPFAGSLTLFAVNGIFAIASRLFSLPGDLRFRELHLGLNNERDFRFVNEFVQRCSSTLEVLELGHYPHGHILPAGELINLSNAPKLKELVLGTHLDPRWITDSLPTIANNCGDLQQVSINIPYALYKLDPHLVDGVHFRHQAGETIHRWWLELYRRLAQLRESRPIKLEVLYDSPGYMRGMRARGHVSELLPEVTTGGIVYLAENTRRDKML